MTSRRSAYILVAINLIDLFLALMVFEYEIAKLLTPGAVWLATPRFFDLLSTTIVFLLTIFNLSVLYFVVRRRLVQHQPWLRWTTLFVALVGISLAIVLGDRFWPIIWPS